MYLLPALATIVGIGFMAAMMAVIPTVLEPGGTITPADTAFAVPTEGSAADFLQSVCPCFEGIPDFATTERDISNQFFKQNESIPDPRYLSTWAWAWGQFLDHDIVITKESTAPEDCYNISFNQDINIPVKRAQSQTTGGCRESRTGLSPMIDASTVYGDYMDPARINSLRVENSCNLKVDEQNFPLDQLCGDVRCNEHVVLHTLHTLFVREHNRLCDILRADINFNNEEERFWKARSIVYSIIQHITYSQWLPSLFGNQRSLLVTSGGQPLLGDGLRITNEFAIAAFRFGHSMVQEKLGPYNLTDLFFQPNFLQTEGIENIITHATTTRAEKVDNQVVDTLRDMLFGTFGMDLVSLNLFRAREVGIGTYRQINQCFQTQGAWVDDVRDPLLGMLSEPLEPGSSLPRTIAVIVAEQFRRLRDNDPNFYTKRVAQIGNPYYSIVRGSSLSNIITRNTQLTNMKSNVFYVT